MIVIRINHPHYINDHSTTNLKRRTLIQEVENLKAERNIVNNNISNKKNNEDCSNLIDSMKSIS